MHNERTADVREIIFNAQVYANAGGIGYKKAVDMAVKDMLNAGLNCVEYKNGARHTLEDYASMAIRTATKRAYLQGEGTKRKEWGISTVILNKRSCPCPKCLPFVGKVFVDDVWSGGTAEEAKEKGYPLLSTAIEQGLYHPNCKYTHTTYFEGISTPPEKPTVKEKQKAVDEYNQNQKAHYNALQAQKCERISEYSLDEENKRIYKARAEQWREKEKSLKPVANSGESGKINKENRPHKLSKNNVNQFEDNNTNSNVFDIQAIKTLANYAGINTLVIEELTTDEVITPFLKQLNRVYEKYNQMFSRVEIVKLPIGDFAQVTSSFVLQLNSYYFNSLSKTNEFFKEMIVNKRLPKGAGIGYSAIHEWSHYVSQQDLQNPKSPMHTLFRRTKEKDFVSKNSALDVYEFIADAIACKESGISCKYADKVVKYYLE